MAPLDSSRPASVASLGSSSAATRVTSPGQHVDPALPPHLHFPPPSDLEKGPLSPVEDYPEEPAKELELEKEEVEDPWFVKWEEGEQANPMNWSKGRRWYLTFLASSLCFCATFASSLPSGAFNEMQEDLGGSKLVTTLVVSLFVAGYCVGPIIWAPLSEVYGRRRIFILTFSIYIIFIIPCALAPNIATLLVSRFIGGVFAASSLTNSGGSIGDLWPTVDRGLPFASFSISPTLGPLVAPIAAGFLGERHGFRAVFWLLLTFSCLIFITFYLTLPETYHPYLLKLKAERLRRETGDNRYWAKLEREDMSLRSIVSKVIARPMVMLVFEPIVSLISLYLAAVYGVIYLFFTLYPAVFQGIHGMSEGIGSLPLLGVAIGAVLGYAVMPYYERKYAIAFAANGNKPVPEERLICMFIGGPLFSVGLFWFGWTSDKHWILPTLSGLATGYSIFFTFQGCLTYLGDCYQYYAASAFAAAQIVRSLAGFGFPLFAGPMIHELGVPWTASLLGFVGLVLSPIPFLFYKYGKRIRKMSRYAFE